MATERHEHPGPDLTLLQEFVSVISHELRTPLTIIHSAADTVIAHPDLEERELLLQTIRRNVKLAMLLLDRITLARDIQGGTVDLEIESVDLVTLVQESVSDLRHAVLGAHEVEVVAPDAITVEADATCAREIVFNLLANASKYSAPTAPIEITIACDGDVAQVVVRNHGSGVTPGNTEVIFERFYQDDPGAPGAGLGLYISRGLARAHGGDIVVQPAADEGSEFSLSLPVRQSSPVSAVDGPGA